jgi:hypothetical protein
MDAPGIQAHLDAAEVNFNPVIVLRSLTRAMTYRPAAVVLAIGGSLGSFEDASAGDTHRFHGHGWLG